VLSLRRLSYTVNIYSSVGEQPRGRNSMQVLLDTSVNSAAQVLQWATVRHTVNWGGRPHSSDVVVMRRQRTRDPDFEAQVAALPTLGRLAREGVIELATYSELLFEEMYGRRSARATVGDLFVGVSRKDVEAAIDRSYFEAVTFPKTGETENLIRFCSMLLRTDRDLSWMRESPWGRLPDLTVRNLQNLARWRAICANALPAHYPDLFHLWTGESNGCAYFLTMEKRLPNFIDSHLRDVNLGCRPVRPTQLLKELGLTELDPMPCERGDTLSFVRATGFAKAQGR
jgi:hypothetical protein